MIHINRPIIYDYPETNEVVSDKSMETMGKLIKECFKEQIQYMFADYLPEVFGKIISHLSKKIPEGIEYRRFDDYLKIQCDDGFLIVYLDGNTLQVKAERFGLLNTPWVRE